MSLTRSVSCCFSFSPLQLTGAFPAMKEQLLAEHRSLLLNQVSLDVVIHWLASYYSFPPSTSLLFLIFLFQLIVQVQALLETSTIDCVKNGEGQGSLNYRLDLAEKVMWFYFDIILLVRDDIFFFHFSHFRTLLHNQLIVAVSELVPSSDWSKRRRVKLRAWKVKH